MWERKEIWQGLIVEVKSKYTITCIQSPQSGILGIGMGIKNGAICGTNYRRTMNENGAVIMLSTTLHTIVDGKKIVNSIILMRTIEFP